MTIGTEEIQLRSYMIWEIEGRPEGRALSHWIQAEEELTKERAEVAEGETSAPPEASTKKGAKA